jgi:hypothetical protein
VTLSSRTLCALLVPERDGTTLRADVAREWGGVWAQLLDHAAHAAPVELASASFYLVGGDADRPKEVREVVITTNEPAVALARVSARLHSIGWVVKTDRSDFVSATFGDDKLYAEADPEGLGAMVYVMTARTVSHDDLSDLIEAAGDELPLLAPFVEEVGVLTELAVRARVRRKLVARGTIALDFERVLVDGERLDERWLAANAFAPAGDGLFTRGRIVIEDRGGSLLVYLGAVPAVAGEWPSTTSEP